MPDLNTVKAIQKIAWAASSCSLHLVHASIEDIHKAHEKVSLSGCTGNCWIMVVWGREGGGGKKYTIYNVLKKQGHLV